jgi:hypothetical protein
MIQTGYINYNSINSRPSTEPIRGAEMIRRTLGDTLERQSEIRDVRCHRAIGDR